MIVSDTAVKNRVTVFFLTVLIIVAGLYCYHHLPREAAPDVQVPYVFISTYYQGVVPEDMEKLVTVPIEKKLKGLSGVKKVSSSSGQGVSQINIEFDTDVDIEDALNRVKDKVDLAKPELPTDLDDDPVVFEVNFSEMPILTLALSAEMSVRDLTELAEDLGDDIEGIPGVLEVELGGKVEREIHVEIDPERLTQYGIGFERVPSIVPRENQNTSGGFVRTETGRYQVRVPSEFEDVRGLADIVIDAPGGGEVWLRDLGRIVDGIEDRESHGRINGRNAVLVDVKKRSGENVIRIVDDCDALIERVRPSWPPGVEVIRIQDRSNEIRDMVSDLENNILTGLLLVVVIVFFAMGLRNAILVSLSIPLSMLMSFIVLRFMGITLNMVVLFSLTLALGMLVDNAIVIIENIYRFMQQGVPRLEAAMRATSEVAYPIIGSALTTIGAFVPLLWWGGVMGGFMGFIPRTVIITLACCLFVALIINPALAAVLMKADNRRRRATADEIMSGGEHPMLAGGGPILSAYRWLLRGALRFRLAVVAFAVFVCVCMVYFWMLRIGLEKATEFFPTPDPDVADVELKMPEGASLEYCDRIVREVAVRLCDQHASGIGGVPRRDVGYRDAIVDYEGRSPSFLPLVKYVSERASTVPGGDFFGGQSANRVTLNFIDFEERGDKSTQAIVNDLMPPLVRDIPGAEVLVTRVKDGPPTGAPINIEISGEDFATLGRLAAEAQEYVKQVEFVRNVRDDYVSGTPTVEVVVDRKRAGVLGLQSADVGYALRLAFNGIKCSLYREGDEDYDIVVRFLDNDRRRVDTLGRIFLQSPAYGKVPLSSVAKVRYAGGLGTITRINFRRVVTVTADVDETKITGAVARGKAEDLMKGSAALRRNDIRDWPGFMQALRNAAAREGSVFHSFFGVPEDASPAYCIYAQLGSSAIEQVSEYNPGVPMEIKGKIKIIEALNAMLKRSDLYRADIFEGAGVPEATVRKLRHGARKLPQHELQNLNQDLLGAAFPGLIRKRSVDVFAPPSGYRYEFTGENEYEREARDFLSEAMLIAIFLILFILVAQFNSLATPFIIMSAVLLSIGGVFLGLGLCNMPFGIIMVGVGVISLAGVVVNNAIVLVDYITQLRARGLGLTDAIIAAGATRLRPVLLTAITTILGLIPMAVGTSYDFHAWRIQWASQSSQWWGPMAVAVIFGLILATLLTLIVVPVLVSLNDTLFRFIEKYNYANSLLVLIGGTLFLGFVYILYDVEMPFSRFNSPVLIGALLLFLFTSWHGRWLWYTPMRFWMSLFDRRHSTDYAARWRLPPPKLPKQETQIIPLEQNP